MISELRGRPLFNAVVAYIEENPQTYDQTVYGERQDGKVTACLAGLTVILVDGDAVKWAEDGCDCDDCKDLNLSQEIDYVDVDGMVVGVGERAADLLGIPQPYSFRLFGGTNTLADLRRIADEMYALLAPAND